jgi:hypothetical protein
MAIAKIEADALLTKRAMIELVIQIVDGRIVMEKTPHLRRYDHSPDLLFLPSYYQFIVGRQTHS